MSTGRLQGKTVWITGAGRGFGAGIARGMALAGANVCISDVNAEELAVTAAEIGADGNPIMLRLVDVTDFATMQATANAILERWGRIDVLVSNAAIMPLRSFDDHTPDFWQRMIAINLTGVYNGVRAVWEQMKQQGGGHLMAIASGASVRGFVDEVAYCTAKHGLEGFSKALALEAAPHNIAINTMGPGKLIKPTSITRAQEQELSEEERRQWVEPVTLAPAFVWLASQPPSRFTGLRFDAGPIVDAIAAEGYDFAFAPEKVTLYVADFVGRMQAGK